MHNNEIEALNKKLTEFILTFPFPFIDVLREQILSATLHTKIYPGCYIIEFKNIVSAGRFPSWLPTVPQCCRVFKESGLYSCQLYIENGYLVQFEVIDMSLQGIDWNYFWGQQPAFDVVFDAGRIAKYLTETEIVVNDVQIGTNHIFMSVNTTDGVHTVCLWGCNVKKFEISSKPHTCRAKICSSVNPGKYILQSTDGTILVEYSLICQQDTLSIV